MADRVSPVQVEFYVNPAQLLDDGPSIFVAVAGSQLTALLDTGAPFSGIDIGTARSLGLPEAGTRDITSATGEATYPNFSATLAIPGLGATVPSPVIGLPLLEYGHPWRAIIGRDVLCSYELTINGRTGLIRFVAA